MMIKTVTVCDKCYEGTKKAAVIKSNWEEANLDSCSRKLSPGGNVIAEAWKVRESQPGKDLGEYVLEEEVMQRPWDLERVWQ